nr:MAG TPA: HNH endonuclease [Caudoviricetes sp.]
MPITRKHTKGKTEAKGLGWRHAQQRSRLIRKHHDGDTCWWCGKPMWRDPHQNWDNKPLAADHIQPRAQGGRLAERLLHFTCNSQRQDGKNDHQRPALTQTPQPTRAEAPGGGGLRFAWT